MDAQTGFLKFLAMNRLIASVSGLLFGVIVGTFGSLYHGALFPWGLTVSILLVTCAMAAIRTLMWERYPSVWFSVGVTLTVMLLAGFDGNGSVLIIANDAGFIFLGAVLLIVVVGIAWPRFRPQSRRYDREAPQLERTSLS